MQPETPGDVQATMFNTVGPWVGGVCLVGVIAVLGLLAFGLFRRVRGRDISGASWWLSACSRFLLLFGLMVFSWHVAAVFMRIGVGGAEAAESLFHRLGLACARLALPVSVALLAQGGVMLVGRPFRKAVDGKSP